MSANGGSYTDDGTPPLKIFQVDLSHLSAAVQLALCITGVFTFHIAHGYLQEAIFRLPGFKFGLYLTLFEFLVYIFFVCVETKFAVRKFITTRPKGGLQLYLLLSTLLLGTIGLGNFSLQYLNYPTKVIFKSSKLIPVMLVGLCVLEKHYSLVEYAAALMLCTGLVLFTLADVTSLPQFQFVGIVLVTGAVLSEAVCSNLQEKLLRQHKTTQVELMFYSNLFSLLILLAILVVTGELFAAVEYCYHNPYAQLAIVLESTLGYVGTNFYLGLIKSFGAPTAVIVASCRKMLTIALSFVFFPKPFSANYVIGAVLVFGGVVLNVYTKQQKQTKKEESV